MISNNTRTSKRQHPATSDSMSSTKAPLDNLINRIIQGDCVSGMNQLPEACIDLAFADPPFNIGYDYDVYNDRLGREKYLDWSKTWIESVYRVLKPTGSFWLAIGDEYAAELKILSQEIGFHPRSWVVWYYTFGVNCKQKFTRSHAHIFYFVKDPASFTFRSDDLDNRIPSARELVYNDKRANPLGRLPDDTWIIQPESVLGHAVADDGSCHLDDIQINSSSNRTWTLRPQDIETCFTASEDTWYFPRVAGTFKERQGFHGCQMPEQLLGRIIRSCSHEGEVVLDPFAGSATTLAVAKKMNREYVGFELSEDYVAYGIERLDGIRVGDRLDGSAEPTKSAPKTGETPNQFYGKKVTKEQKLQSLREQTLVKSQLEKTVNGVAEAFRISHDGYSVDRIVADPAANALFEEACRRMQLAGDLRTWNTLLFRLREAGELSHVPVDRKTTIHWEDLDEYLHASEMALQLLLNRERASHITEILCDPIIASEFDELATRICPGQTPFEYRWGALTLVQQSEKARIRGQVLDLPQKLGREILLADLNLEKVSEGAGVYLLQNGDSKFIYAGETLSLQRRLKKVKSTAERDIFASDLQVRIFPTQSTPADMLSWQSRFVTEFQPELNCRDFAFL